MDYLLPAAAVALAAVGYYLLQPAAKLPPPGTRVFTPTELRRYDGSSPDEPVYLAVKGVVYDVTAKRRMYAPGSSYHALAGRDASKALGVNSLDEENCVHDISSLTPAQMDKLNSWAAFYQRRYPVVGTVDFGGAESSLPIGDGGSAKPKADGSPPTTIGDLVLTPEQLREYDGSDESKPVYVAMKGVIFDVSSGRDSYAPGRAYHVFAGKDASKALGMSSLIAADCDHDYSSLSPKQLDTLNGWMDFYKRKYPAVGRVRFSEVD